MPKKIEFDDFISKAKEVWGDRFTYKKPKDFNYRRGKVQICCSKEGHGWFESAAYYHIGAPGRHKPAGCPVCLTESKRTAQAKPFTKYGSLTAMKFLRRERSRNIWEFECECGNKHIADMASVKFGSIRSCGCLVSKSAKAKIVNLVGQRFTRLTVIRQVEKTHEGGQRGAYWECVCDCGTKKIVRGSRLRTKTNPIRSCGCLQKDKAKNKALDLVGKRFGRLTVKRKSHQIKKQIYWYCECSCGGNTTTTTNLLRMGKSKSCGCLKRDLLKDSGHDLQGKKFASWNVLQKGKSRNDVSYWLCECICGVQRDVSTQSLLMGTSESCGCGTKIIDNKTTSMDYQVFKNLGKRQQTIILNKLKRQIRGSLSRGLKYKKAKKLSSTFDLLNFTPEELIIHLEKQFKEGMNWSNYGEWHIDHIIPLINAKTPEDVIRLNDIQNLQPLWAEENLSKNRY